MQTTEIELECVGNAETTSINDLCQVEQYHFAVNHKERKVDFYRRRVEIKQHHRKGKVNLCTFDIPEKFVCSYNRRVGLKPSRFERRFFKFENGEFIDFGNCNYAPGFAEAFLTDYQTDGYEIITHDPNSFPT